MTSVSQCRSRLLPHSYVTASEMLPLYHMRGGYFFSTEQRLIFPSTHVCTEQGPLASTMSAPASEPSPPPYLLLALLLGLTGEHSLGGDSPFPDSSTSPCPWTLKASR